MTLEYEIEPEAGLVKTIAKGDANLASLIDEMNHLASDKRIRKGFDVLADFRELNYKPAIGDLFAFGNSFKKIKDVFTGKISIVVSDKTQLRLGKLASGMGKSFGAHLFVFDSMEDAQKALSAA